MYREFYSMVSAGAAWIIIIAILFVLGAIAAGIMYLLTLQGALAQVSPQNRKMPPGNVWLLLIPYFNTIYLYFVVKNISESLEAEFRMRGMSVEDRPTYNVGLVYFIIGVAGLVLGFASSLLPWVVTIAIVIANYVFWIIYWVQVNQHKNMLKNAPYYQPEGSQIF